jgi:membrane-associated phospholipid phosphatase
MRTADWINTVSFSFLLILGWWRRLDPPRRTNVTLLGLSGLALTAISTVVLPRVLPPLAASVIRDWLPYLLLLLFYWQAGQCFTQPNVAIERWLEKLDHRLLSSILAASARSRVGRWISTTLELAYLFCYPSLPAGLATLYLMHLGAEADHYWAVVLISTYVCYVAVPFVQTRPPRMLNHPDSLLPRPSDVRRLNLFVLRHASIHVNTLPSAHVAGSTACALVMLQFAPSIGLVFLALAVCIALGAVAGRYHYAADIILGAVVAVAAFLVVGFVGRGL